MRYPAGAFWEVRLTKPVLVVPVVGVVVPVVGAAGTAAGAAAVVLVEMNTPN